MLTVWRMKTKPFSMKELLSLVSLPLWKPLGWSLLAFRTERDRIIWGSGYRKPPTCKPSKIGTSICLSNPLLVHVSIRLLSVRLKTVSLFFVFVLCFISVNFYSTVLYSWVPGLTLLNKLDSWTHSWNGTHLYERNLLYFQRKKKGFMGLRPKFLITLFFNFWFIMPRWSLTIGYTLHVLWI